MRHTTARLLAVAAALALAAPAARAQQFTISADINCSLDGGFSYRGGFNTVDEIDDECGSASDGGRDAFDDFGNPVGYRRLQVTRRTEVFQSRNLIRWYDTYTNSSARTFTGFVGLSGELGSDSDSQIRRYADDYVVTADADPETTELDFDGNPLPGFGNDPVVAFVFGNNAFSRSTFAGDFTSVDEPDELFLGGRVTLAPGETRSFLFFAFLALDEGPNGFGRESRAQQRADEDLAAARAEQLAADPFVRGLSNEERARIANFDVGPSAVVPEPGTWAMVGAGLAGLGAAARRRRA